MASITITLTDTCAAGGHLTFGISGDRTGTVRMTLDDLSVPITSQDAEAFCRVVTKMAKAGRTNAQARTLLQAGVTVTI